MLNVSNKCTLSNKKTHWKYNQNLNYLQGLAKIKCRFCGDSGLEKKSFGTNVCEFHPLTPTAIPR